MVSQKVKITNPSGLYLKTATVLSNSAIKYNSIVQFAYRKNDVNGIVNVKSILNIVAAGIRQGSEIEITCEGDDENEALQSVICAVESGIGEKLSGL